MKKVSKRFLAILFFIVVMMVAIPMAAITAFAESGSLVGNYVTRINGVGYETIQDAIDVADGKTVVVVDDVVVASPLVVNAGKVVVIDLNGKTITAGLKAENRHHYAIDNYGTLTIKDSVGGGQIIARGVENFGTMTIESGKIVSCDNNGGAAIWNEGNLTVNGGTFTTTDNNDTTLNSHAGVLNNSGTAVLNGGSFVGNQIRTYAVLSSGDLTVNAGVVVEGFGGIGVEGGVTTINGVTLTNKACAYSRHALYVVAGELNVLGGTFTSSNATNTGNVIICVEGGEAKVEAGTFVAIDNAGVASVNATGTLAISGGTFNAAVAEEHCASGMIPVANGDGTYGVKVGKFVARVNGRGYETIQEAIDVADGKTVVVVDDVVVASPLVVNAGKVVVIDLNGKTITAGLKAENRHHYAIDNYGTLTIKDSVGGGQIIARGVKNYGTLTVEGVAITACDVNGGSAIWNEGNLTVNSGTFTNVECLDEVLYSASTLYNSGTAVLNGGTFDCNQISIYAIINRGTLTVNDGVVISGRGGIAVETGSVTINGGAVSNEDCALTAHALYVETGSVVINGGTFTATDDAQCGNSVVYVANGSAEIKGGTFHTNAYTKNPYVGAASAGTIAISGGTFDKAVDEAYCVAGYLPEDNGDGTYDVSFAGYIKVTYKDGTVKHFKDILEAVPYKTNYDILEGATITLLNNYTGSGIRFMEKDMTLDLNGFTFTINQGTGSQGTRTQAFQVRDSATNAVIKNGKIEIATADKMSTTDPYVVWVFHSYTNLTVKDVEVDMTNMAWSVYGSTVTAIAVQSGDSVALVGNSKITNFDESYGGYVALVDGTLSFTDAAAVPGKISAISGATIIAPAGMENSIEIDSTEFIVYESGEYKVYTRLATVNGKDFASLQAALDYAVVAADTVVVEIIADIDLTGTNWIPVYFDSYKVDGANTLIINGNGKTITGLDDMLFSGIWTGTKFEVNNLIINNANILHDVNDTQNVGVGAIVGNVSAIEEVVLNNVKLTNSHVEGGHWTGGFFGYIAGYSGNDGPVFTTVSIENPVFTTVSIENCEVSNSTITGKGSVGGVVGHATGDAWTSFGIEESVVSGNEITSTGSSTNKAGIVAGTIGAAGSDKTTNGTTLVGGVSVAVTESGNTATSNGTAITTVYGRQGSSTGKIEITGGTYENNPIEENVDYAGPADGVKIVENADGSYGVIDRVYKTYTVGAGKDYATLAQAIAAANAEDIDYVTFVLYGANELETGYSHGIVDFGANLTVTIDGGDASAKLTIVGGGVPDIKGVTMKNIIFADEGQYLPTANEFMYQNFIDTEFVNVTFKDGVRLSGTSTLTNCTFDVNTTNEYAIWLDDGDFAISGSKVIAGVDSYGLVKSDTATTLVVENNVFEYLGAANKEALNVKGVKVTATGNTFIDCDQGILPADKTNYAADGSTVITDAQVVADNTVVIHDAKIGTQKYLTVADAFAAAKKGDTIELLKDVTATEQIKVVDQSVLSDITVNGNGHKITANLNKDNQSVLYFGNVSTSAWATGVEINDLTIEGTARFAIALMGGTSSVLNKVTVTGDYVYGVNLYGTHGATMTDCDIVSVFTNGSDDYKVVLNNTEIKDLYANESEITEEEGKIIISDDSRVTNYYFWGDSTKVIMSGIENVENIYNADGLAFVAKVNEHYYTALAPAIADAGKVGGVITLLADANVQSALKVNADLVLNLNGYTMTLPDLDNYGIVVKANLTINGDGKVVAGDFGIGTATSFTGTLTINGGEYVGKTYLIGAFGGNVVINDGTFYADYCVVNSFDGYTATVQIHGGNFAVGTEDGASIAYGINITVDGGIYSHELDEDYIKKGLVMLENGDGTWGLYDVQIYRNWAIEDIESLAGKYLVGVKYSENGIAKIEELIATATADINTLWRKSEIDAYEYMFVDEFNYVLTAVEERTMQKQAALELKEYASLMGVSMSDARVTAAEADIYTVATEYDILLKLEKAMNVVDTVAAEMAQALQQAKEKAIADLMGDGEVNKNNVTSAMIASIYAAKTIDEVTLAYNVAYTEMQEIIAYKALIKNASDKADANAQSLADIATALQQLSDDLFVGADSVLGKVEKAIADIAIVQATANNILSQALTAEVLQQKLDALKAQLDTTVANAQAAIETYLAQNVIPAIEANSSAFNSLKNAVEGIQSALGGRIETIGTTLSAKIDSVLQAIAGLNDLSKEDVADLVGRVDFTDVIDAINRISNKVSENGELYNAIINKVSDLLAEVRTAANNAATKAATAAQEATKAASAANTASANSVLAKTAAEQAQAKAEAAKAAAEAAKVAAESLMGATNNAEDAANAAAQAAKLAQEAAEAARDAAQLAAEKAQTATVKAHAANVEATLKEWILEYIGGLVEQPKQLGVLNAPASAEVDNFRANLDSQLTANYSDENRALILSYYDQAMAQINAATSTAEIDYALESFKSNVGLVDSLGMLAPESNDSLVALLAVVAGVEGLIAAALIVGLILIIKRKKQNGDDDDDDDKTAIVIPVETDDIEEETTEQPTETVEETAATEEVAAVETAEEEEESEEEIEDDDDEEEDGEVNPFAGLKGKSKTFEERLAEADEITKANFEAIKSELESYKRISTRLSKKAMSFRVGRVLVVKTVIRGKTLRCYLSLDPAAYEFNKFHHRDASDKKAYALVPMMMKVRSGRALKRTLRLIGDVAEKFALVKKA